MGKRKEESVEKARRRYGRNKEILGCIRGGWSAKKIAAEFSLSYSWAKKLCRRLKNGDNGERKFGSGRPRKTTPREDRYLVNEALKTRDSAEVCPTADDLAQALRERSSTKISASTVQRRLRERNIKKCAKTKKPFVSAVNRRKRVEFARRHRDWTIEEWEKVLWSDESPYSISCQTRQYVWRTPQDKYSPRCLQGTVKHQKKIMVWGCFSWHGVGALYNIKGILKKEK